MGQLVKPKVFLVGATEVDPRGLKDYLEYTRQEEFWPVYEQALAEGLTSGEALCSVYAKMCYKSLVLGKNSNVSKVRDVMKNLEGCHDTGHGCYDAETDVLTEMGWKAWPEVLKDDKLATLDAATGNLVYRKPVAVNQFQHQGRMYRVESEHVDLLVTPNHKMYVCRTTTRDGRKKADESYRLIEAQELGSAAHAYIKTADWKPDDPVCSPGNSVGLMQPAELQLLGFAIGDGYYPGSGNVVRFRLRRHRKITFLRELAKKLNYDLRENGDRFSLSVDTSISTLFAKMYDEFGEKQIPQQVFDHPAEYLNDLLEGLLAADGHRGETGDSFDTTSPRLVDQFSQLCLHVGAAANVVYTYEGGDRPMSFGDKPLTRLSVIRRATRPVVNKWAGQKGGTSWIEEWSGDVYCAHMGADTKNVLYVRRNGKPVWCGNSVFEHCQLNFIVTDCSRVYTHEQVRHRIGWSYSQTSGRYCRLDKIDLVWSELLNPVKHLWLEGLGYIEDLVYLSECKLGLRKPPPKHPNVPAEAGLLCPANEWKATAAWQGVTAGTDRADLRWVPDDSFDFDKRKAITSAIRRIAPNGQANEIGMSCNIRALRSTVQVRTARFAETEIRDIFNQVYTIVKARFPTIFYKARTKEFDGLLEVYGMKTQPFELPAGDPAALEFFTSDTLRTELDKRQLAA